MRAVLADPSVAILAKSVLNQAAPMIVARSAAIIESLSGKGLTLSSDAGSGYDYLDAMARAGTVVVTSEEGGIRRIPCRGDFLTVISPLPCTVGTWRLSRFTTISRIGDEMMVRCPLGDSYLLVADPEAQAAIPSLVAPRRREEIEVPDLFDLLIAASCILPCDNAGDTIDETDADRLLWEPHDLLFHSRSRLGRADPEIGGTYAKPGSADRRPAVKENRWKAGAIPLYRPDLAMLAQSDPPLSAILESRCSVRKYGIVPPTAAELGAFLYRTARVKYRLESPDESFAWRPYPSGGALYEQEFYVTIDACTDLVRGFYYYDPEGHALCPIRAPDAEIEALLYEASMSAAFIGRPQILITIASRFARFNRKYSGMSYAAQIKNIGAIYQTMYLVATAMGLGGCALGLGNSDRFCRIAAVDYLQEGSLGEFMLGKPV
jgi:SagB-type dehydrogenase family enzyme